MHEYELDEHQNSKAELANLCVRTPTGTGTLKIILCINDSELTPPPTCMNIYDKVCFFIHISRKMTNTAS